MKFKRLLSVILAVVISFGVIPLNGLNASAQTTYKNGYYTYTVSTGEVTIVKVDTSISGSITIPSKLGGYPVTKIGDSAFEECFLLTSVIIPNSVTSIGKSAFAYCDSLTTITIPNSVVSIGSGAFYVCCSLTSITIPNSVTSIGDYAFGYCDLLTTITIPSSVTSIGYATFGGCDSLARIVVEKHNEVYHSFDNCIIETQSKKLVSVCKNSTIPNDGSVTSIGDYAFYEFDTLMSITIPNSVVSIGNGAFMSCCSLTDITIPNSVTSIGYCAFMHCCSLTDITIPNSVTSIGDEAFFGCTDLTIYGESGSYVETYTKNNNILFEYIGLNTTEMYTLIANDYPTYLINDDINYFLKVLNEHCYETIEEYDENENKLLAFAESFVNGSKILSQNVFANLGVGQTVEEEWLEKNTLKFIQSLEELDTLSADIWKEIKNNYEQIEFVYKTSDSVSKSILIEQISKVQKHLTSAEVKKVVDDVYDNLDKYGVDSFFDLTGKAIDGVDIVVYACQLYQLETTTINRVMELIAQNTPLYEGLNNILNKIKSSPAEYISEKYLSKIVGPILVDMLKKFGKIVFVRLAEKATKVEVVLPNISTTSDIVKLSLEVIYNHIYQGAKIDEIYGAITAYDFYATANISINEMINKMLQHKLNGTSPSTKLLSDYEFMYNVRRVLINQYIDSCIEIAKSDAQVEDLKNLRSTVNNDYHFAFDNYIKNHCYAELEYDISNNTIECTHVYAYVDSSVLPSCTSSGYTQYYCPTCYILYTADYIAALGHSYSSTVYLPTCIDKGYTAYKCSTCGASYTSEYVSAKGHIYSDWIITKEPTIYEVGYKQQICSVCKEVVAEKTMPKLIYYGDTNGDGEITASDLVETRILLLSLNMGAYNESYDANGDGQINIIDLIRLKKYLAGYSVRLGKN